MNRITLQNIIGEHTAASEQETRAIGRKLAEMALPGDVICVSGELGAGKTVFSKGVAEGLGIDPEEVSSPTFAIVHEHVGRIGMVHADFYRMKDADEARKLGWDEYMDSRRVVLIEWPEIAPELAPAQRWHVHIASCDPNQPLQRIITINKLNG